MDEFGGLATLPDSEQDEETSPAAKKKTWDSVKYLREDKKIREFAIPG